MSTHSSSSPEKPPSALQTIHNRSSAKNAQEEILPFKLHNLVSDLSLFVDRALDQVEDVYRELWRKKEVAPPPLATDLNIKSKHRVVIAGTGWGGYALAKVIHA